jgi:hypothetical protein
MLMFSSNFLNHNEPGKLSEKIDQEFYDDL